MFTLVPTVWSHEATRTYPVPISCLMMLNCSGVIDKQFQDDRVRLQMWLDGPGFSGLVSQTFVPKHGLHDAKVATAVWITPGSYSVRLVWCSEVGDNGVPTFDFHGGPTLSPDPAAALNLNLWNAAARCECLLHFNQSRAIVVKSRFMNDFLTDWAQTDMEFRQIPSGNVNVYSTNQQREPDLHFEVSTTIDHDGTNSTVVSVNPSNHDAVGRYLEVSISSQWES